MNGSVHVKSKRNEIDEEKKKWPEANIAILYIYRVLGCNLYHFDIMYDLSREITLVIKKLRIQTQDLYVEI